MDPTLASKQKTSFRFLDLRSELRNHIYADIVTTTYKTLRPLPWCYPSAACLTILTVSKPVYQEARHILCKTGTFNFHIPISRSP